MPLKTQTHKHITQIMTYMSILSQMGPKMELNGLTFTQGISFGSDGVLLNILHM